MKTEYSFNIRNWWDSPLSSVAGGTIECFNCHHTVSPLFIRSFPISYIRVCPKCFAPNVFDDSGKPLKQAPYGVDVDKLPDEIREIYKEMRDCFSINAYTSVVTLARTLITHICHSMAEKDGGNEEKIKVEKLGFEELIDWLEEANVLPKPMKPRLDKIRKLANKAVHGLEMRNKEEARLAIDFMGHFLKSVYEFADSEESEAPSPKPLPTKPNQSP